MCHEVSGQDYVESIDALARAVTTLKKQVAESGGEENPRGDFKLLEHFLRIEELRQSVGPQQRRADDLYAA